MKLENSFEVEAEPDRAWAFLLDPELVVPCMPGAKLAEVIDAGTWEAIVKVKLGPVTMNFKGKVVMEERDDEARRATMTAKGSETRGKGMFNATITSTLAATEAGSRVDVVTDLKLSGKAATFSRGMIGDISQKLTKEFAKNMAEQIAALPREEAEPEAEAAPAAAPEPEPQTEAEPTPIATKAEVEPRERADPPAKEAEAIGGVGLFVWAIWRSIVRFFRRIFGSEQG